MHHNELYQLLPAVYRIRDSERGGPLQSLMRVISEQAQFLQQDIEHLYDNWFIETCQDWVVPYLGELVGFRRGRRMGEPSDTNSPTVTLLQKIYPRREVSRLIDTRKRKGTLDVFQDLSFNVAGWHAFAQEDLLSLVVSTVAEYRRDAAKMARSVEWPRPAVAIDLRVNRTPKNIRVFAWRRTAQSVSNSLPTNIASDSEWQLMSLSPYGFDVPLVILPQATQSPRGKQICSSEGGNQEDRVDWRLMKPTFLERDFLTQDIKRAEIKKSTQVFGKSLSISTFKLADIGVKNLSNGVVGDAVHANKKVYIDPVLGRIAVRHQNPVPNVTYHTAELSKIGGGEYLREMAYHDKYPVYRRVPSGSSKLLARGILIGVGRSELRRQRDRITVDSSVGFELAGSAVYTAKPATLHVRMNQTFELRAANKARPVIRIENENHDIKSLTIEMERGSRLVLDGVAIIAEKISIRYVESKDESRVLTVDGCECVEPDRPKYPEIYVRHATIAPSVAAKMLDGSTSKPEIGTVAVCLPGGVVSVKNSIVARCAVEAPCVESVGCPVDPVLLRIHDSIVHRSIDGIDPASAGHVSMETVRSTFFGDIHVHQMESGEDSIFDGTVEVDRQQYGHLRFCFVASGSRLPPRFRCLPNQKSNAKPEFVSREFGRFGYGQLHTDCADAISAGAESDSEMGAFHDLFESQRKIRLNEQLEDFRPSDMHSVLDFADETPPR